MHEATRILVLEDVAADVVQITDELRGAGLKFRCKRVQTKEDFLRELQNHAPDVILSNYRLPSFDGFTALALASEQCPGTPFIFVTAAVGELMAIEMFKSGAVDYVLKERLGDLAPAVRRALRQAKARAKGLEAETGCRAAADRFRSILESLEDFAIFMLDRKGHVTFWNAGAERWYGWSAEETKGRFFSMFYTEEDIEQGKPRRDLHAAAGAGHLEEEGQRVGKGGKRFAAHVVVTALRDAKGVLYGFVQATSKAAGDGQQEGEMRDREALPRFILETAVDATLRVGPEGKIEEWNLGAQRLFGYAREEVIGKSPDELIMPARVRQGFSDDLTQYLSKGGASLIGQPIELTLMRNGGAEFQADLWINRNPQEGPPHCTVLIRETMQRKGAETALRESEERYRTLIEQVEDYAIYTLDPQGRVATWNTGAERIKGYSAQEIIGQLFAIFFTPEDVKQDVPGQLLKRAALEGRVACNGERIRKNGERIWIQGFLTALHDDQGHLRGFFKIAHDITRQREAEAKIRQLNEELERRVAQRTAQLEMANTELEAFSFSISHELRAPLRRISGFVDILHSEAAPRLDEKSLKHLQTISEGAQQMSNLIDALLEFSRMGRSEMRNEKVDIARLVAAARRELHRDFNGREIEWTIGELLDANGDALMLKQAVINLLSNALKFTRSRKPAKIEIGAKREGDETIYFIRDNGVGFDMSYAGKLFGVFQRLHPPREFEGSGIGLANVRRILRRHGGRVWAEGAVNEGATFYFSLPESQTKVTL